MNKNNIGSDDNSIPSKELNIATPINNIQKSRSPKTKTASKILNFSASTPAKLEKSNIPQFPPSRLQVSRSMDEDGTWWSDDETDISTSMNTTNCNETHRAKSSPLPANNNGLRQLNDAMHDGVATSALNGHISADVNSVNQLSSSVKSCNDASAFESFSCTDEDEDDDCDESDPDSASIESSIINNR